MCGAVFFGIGYCVGLAQTGNKVYSSSGAITTSSPLSDAELETIQIIAGEHDENFKNVELKLSELEIVHSNGKPITISEIKSNVSSSVSTSSYVVYVSFKNNDSSIVKKTLNIILESTIEMCDEYTNLSGKVFLLNSASSVSIIREKSSSPLKIALVAGGAGVILSLVVICLMQYFLDLVLDYEDLLRFDCNVFIDVSSDNGLTRKIDSYIKGEDSNYKNNYRFFLQKAQKSSETKSLRVTQIIPSCSTLSIGFGAFVKNYCNTLKRGDKKRICIIDFDLQNHACEKALSKIVFHDIKEVIKTSNFKDDNLYLKFSKEELISNVYMQDNCTSLIKTLSEVYDYIILVQPNPAFAENYLLCKEMCNLNIVLVKKNISKRKRVIEIVNGVDSENYIIKVI